MDSKSCSYPGICIFCMKNPSQLPSKGFCATCEENKIPGSPSRVYPKCSFCHKYHALPSN